jgi:SAM-dependent methyltransferase
MNVATMAQQIRAHLKRRHWMVRMVHAGRSAVSRVRLWQQYGSWWWRKGPDRLPIPPPWLLFLVAGTADVSWFLRTGRLGFESLIETLSRNGIEPRELSAVLDFGCGCGRVIRYWKDWKGTRIHGVDYNPRLVEWCRRNLPFASFAVNQSEPPLPFARGELDFVYALSVFTHLSESAQTAWMGEMARVIRPGGHLLLTTHGESYLDQLSENERSAFRSGALVVVEEAAQGTNLCNAFHPVEYVKERLAREWEVVDFVPMGARGNPHQDLFLLRRP